MIQGWVQSDELLGQTVWACDRLACLQGCSPKAWHRDAWMLPHGGAGDRLLSGGTNPWPNKVPNPGAPCPLLEPSGVSGSHSPAYLLSPGLAFGRLWAGRGCCPGGCSCFIPIKGLHA